MLTSVIVKSKKPFPTFIRYHRLIDAPKNKIDKIFSKLGLSNCQENIDLKLNSIVDPTTLIIDTIDAWNSEWANAQGNYQLCRLAHDTLLEQATVRHIFGELRTALIKKQTAIRGKTLYLTTAITDQHDRSLVKCGTPIPPLLENLLKRSKKFFKTKITAVDPYKINQELKKVKLVFSAADEAGAWDLATMSMRGIKSCVRWEGQHATCLIGSLLDPGCGILYLTNGSKTPYGSKMLFRAIVRLAVKGKEPCLILEKNYSTYYKSTRATKNCDDELRKHFITFLTQKTKNKLPIIDATSASFNAAEYKLPTFKQLQQLTATEWSYRDSDVVYATTTNLSFDSAAFLKNLKS